MSNFRSFKPGLIRSVQIKFVSLAMGILIIVFLLMLGSINVMMQTVSQSQSLRLLIQIAESDRYRTLSSSEEEFPLEQEPLPVAEGTTTNEAVTSVQPLAYSWGEGWENWGGWGGWGDWNTPEETREEVPDNGPHDIPDPGALPTETQQAVETQPEQPAEVPNTPTEVQDTPAAETEAPQEEQSVLTPEAGVETLPEDTMETEPETEETDTMPPTQATTGETETEATDEILQTPPPEVEKQDKWNVTVTIDHFAILVDHDGNFLELRNTEDYTSAQAEEIMCGILETGQQQGMYGWLQYYVTEKEYGTLIVVTDKTSDQGLLNNLFRITVIVGCLMLLLLFVLLCIFSRWITMPVQTAFDRQKQFVSDAGHELKTPLTILSANADILQDEIGENKWLGYMREQTGRMSQLVGDLLRLARMDNASQEYVFTSFNLSTAVAATALPFESQAFELHKNLELDVQPDVSYNGSEQHIRQLVAIFIDNALKYSDENGIIKVTLLQRGDNRILEFYNTGCEISADETEKIFERFYRGDKARGNSGKKGYGLGLAIARSIMDIHKIKIQVTCEQNEWIRFLLTM